MKCEQRFFKIYGHERQGVSFCPYRVCPIGAHIDHQKGKVTGFALDKGVHIAFHEKKNGVVEITSLNFDKRAQWHINSTPKIKENDWADYLRGATISLANRYQLDVGVCGVIEGSLPIGGLSSSAAVTIAFLQALTKVNNIKLLPGEIIEIAREAENKYVGVSCGTLDQSCEVYCKKGNLLYLDTKTGGYQLIPASPKMKAFKIAIFFSGIERNLSSSKYNMRIDECKSAAYSLMAYAGKDYGKIEDTFLSDVGVEVFEAYKNRLPQSFAKRAEHYFTESARVEKGVEAWRNGDIEGFGRLIFESGYSSIYNYETGSEELKTLFEIMQKTDGIYGGRFSGAGFKGCCMAIIDAERASDILENVKSQYLKAFPKLADKYSAHLCMASNGVGIDE